MLNLSKPRAGGWSVLRTLQWNSFSIASLTLLKIAKSCQCGNGRQSYLDIAITRAILAIMIVDGKLITNIRLRGVTHETLLNLL